ncbi:hypothetical protein Pmani_010232 [Petrolisthes manimaculis]|uniref:Uncharacterized protein n=1 Tax=Petrolisthes manimaculis TaxID=1843537 RepID=A0AAE1Q3K2_9EUCA|nr:hypothetical protein Pmani_010232 [Petrolisthes manimaculis]
MYICVCVSTREREEQRRQERFAGHLYEKEEYDFFRNLRVTKKTFNFLLQIFKDTYDPHFHDGRDPIPTKTLLMLTVWYLWNQQTYREIGELFGQANEAALLIADGYVFPPTEDVNIGQAIDLPPEIGGNEKRDFVAASL